MRVQIPMIYFSLKKKVKINQNKSFFTFLYWPSSREPGVVYIVLSPFWTLQQSYEVLASVDFMWKFNTRMTTPPGLSRIIICPTLLSNMRQENQKWAWTGAHCSHMEGCKGGYKPPGPFRKNPRYLEISRDPHNTIIVVAPLRNHSWAIPLSEKGSISGSSDGLN